MPIIIRLAEERDAQQVAELSHRAVEHGLPWQWTPPAVRAAIRDARTNVIVAEFSRAVIGFGVMAYEDEQAHLVLFAVDRPDRRKGLGSRLLLWLEAVAIAAGISRIKLECRAENTAALAFYRRHGYVENRQVQGMYFGVEDGIRLVKALRADSESPG